MVHSTISQNVAEYLRKKIISGDFEAGEKLKEKELSVILKVSTAPVREAFRILENDHLVLNTQRKGCAVNKFSVDDCRQIFKVREVLECCAIDLFEEQGITELPAVVLALNSSSSLTNVSSEDERKLIEDHNPFPEFHIKMVESTENNWLINIYSKISPTVSRYQFLSYSYVPGLLKEQLDEHSEILRLIQIGGYDEAKAMLRAHLSRFLRRIEERPRF
jgi:DNA-binding GntR family transcriptional regulator